MIEFIDADSYIIHDCLPICEILSESHRHDFTVIEPKISSLRHMKRRKVKEYYFRKYIHFSLFRLNQAACGALRCTGDF